MIDERLGYSMSAMREREREKKELTQLIISFLGFLLAAKFDTRENLVRGEAEKERFEVCLIKPGKTFKAMMGQPRAAYYWQCCCCQCL